MIESLRPFHLAMPCNDIKKTTQFYKEVLTCEIGRQDETWVDLNFFGHQLVFHYCGDQLFPSYINPVDKKKVQLPHFGIILGTRDFKQLSLKLKACNVKFIIEPYTRFKGTIGEQSTLFFLDPNGYALEFKSFENDKYIFKPFENPS